MKKQKIRLEDNTLVEVVSRVKGGLTYKSERSGIPYHFEDYGDTQTMELGDLRRMLSGAKKFFTLGWIEVLDEDIVEYLNLGQYQKNILREEQIEKILYDSTPLEIKEALTFMDANKKKIIYGFAKEAYEQQTLTNINTIQALEEALGRKITLKV